MRALAAAVGAIALALAATPARAAGERGWAEPGTAHFFIEPRAGALLLKQARLTDRYGDAHFYGGLRLGWLVESRRMGVGKWRLPGTLAFSIEGGYFRDTGRDLTAPFPELTLFLFPAAASAEYALRFREEPLWYPYVGGGFDVLSFREEVALTPEVATSGVRFGWHAEAGLRFLLDKYDRHAERTFRETAGVYNTWIGLRARYQDVKQFDLGIDFTGYLFDGSLLLEF